MGVYLKLAIRNIFRNARRTAITLAAMACGATAIILFGGFVHFTFWGVRNSSFAYQRSSPNVPEPSASFTLLGGLGLLVACRSYSRRRRKRPTS